jgi:adenine-specific DNA-methyltransferase
MPYMRRYLDESKGVPLQDIWDDIQMLRGINGEERLGYPSQKPEALLERIIKASRNEGDLVADFFAGSGTTAAIAEKLGRKWICADLGKFAIHTTRMWLIQVQRERTDKGRFFAHLRGAKPRPLRTASVSGHQILLSTSFGA